MALKLIDGNNRFRSLWEKLGPDALLILYNASISYVEGHKIIWVWDGENGTKLRKNIFPEYKGVRPKGTDQFHETMQLFRDLLKHSNCLQLIVPEVEADDVIAKIAKETTDIVEIDSNDADFLALVSERVNVNREPIPGVLPDFIHLYKTLVGDKSDGIKGLPQFGDGTWGKLIDSERILLQKHFEGEKRLSGTDCAELLGWKPGLAKKWDDNLDLLDVYWQVTAFLPVRDELISSNISAGTINVMAAQKLLSPFLLTMDNEKGV